MGFINNVIHRRIFKALVNYDVDNSTNYFTDGLLMNLSVKEVLTGLLQTEEVVNVIFYFGSIQEDHPIFSALSTAIEKIKFGLFDDEILEKEENLIYYLSINGELVPLLI